MIGSGGAEGEYGAMMNLALDDHELLIAGAGPAGLLVARGISRVDVLIVERSKRIGFPPHCTGLVSPYTASVFGYREAISDLYSCAVFLDSKLSERCRICGSPSPLAVRIARPMLEKLLLSDVESKGHRVSYATKLIGLNKHGMALVESSGSVRGLKAKWLIIATGASGLTIADKVLGRHKCDRIVGIEVRLKLSRRLSEDASQHFYTIHRSAYSPEMFAWLIPVESGRELLVGVASKARPLEKLIMLLKRVERYLGGSSLIVYKRSGTILRGPPRPKALVGNIVAIGDALCASKPFTGGGLYAIARLAPVLSEGIEKKKITSYIEAWRRLSKSLRLQKKLTRISLSLGETGWWITLETLCQKVGRRACSIDYDRHEKLVECVVKP